MTNEQKIAALTDLLSNVIHSLEMTKYEIEDVSEAANVIREADHYHQQMLNIQLHLSTLVITINPNVEHTGKKIREIMFTPILNLMMVNGLM